MRSTTSAAPSPHTTAAPAPPDDEPGPPEPSPWKAGPRRKPSTPTGRRRRILLVTALPLVLGIVVVLQSATVGRPGSGGEPVPPEFLPGLFFPWMLYALLAPAVCLLVERVPLGRDEWLRRLPLHLAGSVGFAVVHLALATTLHLLVYRPPDLGWASFFRSNLGGFLISDLTQYVLLAGTSHALLFYARFRERERAALRLEARLTEARLRALRGQLAPHFLFNTLNTVAALAGRGDTEAVREVVNDLGDLLRLTLEESDDARVPVGRELERLERYVAIQRARYGSRLRVLLRVSPGIREAMVPGMILQPLVENAIKHGLARHREDLRVEVILREDESGVEVVVEDDGPGFREPPGELRSGVGLDNLRSRLAELYGEAHTLELGASAVGGARVRLRLPPAPTPPPRGPGRRSGRPVGGS